jgi:flagellar hook-length control protein FliK
MMSTLSSSLLSSKPSHVAPTLSPPAQPQTLGAQSKRFANIMAKAQAAAKPTAPLHSPPAAPPAQAKPTASENTAQTGSGSEASRADANARLNAKASARMLATRAQIKAPATEVEPPTPPRTDPYIAGSDSPPPDAQQADSKAVDATATLAADMAAWVAALNPAPAPPAAASASQTASELVMAESDLPARLMVQAAGQEVADKNAQVLREEADADRHADAQPGAARNAVGPRAAIDLHRSRSTADGNANAAREDQASASRGFREAQEARAVSRSAIAVQTDGQAGTPSAQVLALLNKEISGAAFTTTATAAATATATATANPASTAATDFSALLANNLNAITASASGSTPTAATLSLSTPVNAPEFREALGLQVSLLARDGVQTAELHLNPKEMGPVSIQIVMDGTQARVDFGADVAATRAAIEASMPELATALLDAGFTLAGGGVSQHAKGKDSSEGETRQSASRQGQAAQASSPVDSTAQPTRRRVQVTAGGVDLFA